MSKKTHPTILEQEEKLLEAGIEAQQEGLRLLLAEMRALAALLPGDEQVERTDAEIEADFDNMPV